MRRVPLFRGVIQPCPLLSSPSVTMMSVEDMIPHLYHEKQEDGSLLCAQHALNSLLRAAVIFLLPFI